METIYIKKQAHAESPGGFWYAVPAVGIKTREGLRLIPHPYGTETTAFESLELTIEQVHRAGYAAEFEGKHYPVPSRQAVSKPRPSVRNRHDSALLSIVAQALPLLQEQLHDNNPSVIASAAFVLGEMKDESAMTGLVHALSNEDATVRKNVTEALAKIGKPSLGPVLLALKDKHWLVRHSALAVIMELIHINIDLVPELLPEAVGLLKDDSWLVRSQAASVLGEAARVYHIKQEKERSGPGAVS